MQTMYIYNPKKLSRDGGGNVKPSQFIRTLLFAVLGVLIVISLNLMSGPINQDAAKPAPAIGGGIKKVK
jgi:hypothetical protein